VYVPGGYAPRPAGDAPQPAGNTPRAAGGEVTSRRNNKKIARIIKNSKNKKHNLKKKSVLNRKIVRKRKYFFYIFLILTDFRVEIVDLKKKICFYRSILN
jgi:hypothetical protein